MIASPCSAGSRICSRKWWSTRRGNWSSRTTPLLKCGRKLGEVKAMIVRACARRHFRKTLGGPRKVAVAKRREVGLLRRCLEAVGLLRRPPAGQPPGSRQGRPAVSGDKGLSALRLAIAADPALCAIRARHPPRDWPLAAQDQGTQGTSLPGRRGGHGGDPRESSAAVHGRRLDADDLDRRYIDGEVLWRVCTQMDLNRLFSDQDTAMIRKVIALVAGTSREMLEGLMPLLGHDIRLFVTFLFIAYARLGEVEYRNSFMSEGATGWMGRRYLAGLAALGTLPPPRFRGNERSLRHHFRHDPQLKRRAPSSVGDGGTERAPKMARATGWRARDRLRSSSKPAFATVPASSTRRRLRPPLRSAPAAAHCH